MVSNGTWNTSWSATQAEAVYRRGGRQKRNHETKALGRRRILCGLPETNTQSARSSFIGRVKPLICGGFAQLPPVISPRGSVVEFPLQPCICCLEI